MNKSLNRIAAVGIFAFGIALLVMFASGFFNHLFFSWQVKAPGVFEKKFPALYGGVVSLTVDYTATELWTVRRPCAGSSHHFEVIDILVDKSVLGKVDCTGQNSEAAMTWRHHFWFLDRPKPKPAPEQNRTAREQRNYT